LKTIVYYTRTTAARDAVKFTVDKDIEKQMQSPPPSQTKILEESLEGIACSLDNPEACEMCSS
jgi:ribonucleoside-diphosphate reductase alpha chain